MLWNFEKKKLEMCHFLQADEVWICVYIVMRWPDFTEGIPMVPSNFYPSLKQLDFKMVFFKKKWEGFVDV